jgi:hypothetical protein
MWNTPITWGDAYFFIFVLTILAIALYFIIKWAVKNGIQEAYKESKKQIDYGEDEEEIIRNAVSDAIEYIIDIKQSEAEKKRSENNESCNGKAQNETDTIS